MRLRIHAEEAICVTPLELWLYLIVQTEKDMWKLEHTNK